jgi:transposase
MLHNPLIVGNATQSTDRRQYCTTALVFLRRFVYPSSSDHRTVALGGFMAGRRIDTVDIRDVVRHLRDTTNDSAVQRATGLNRRTIQRYRRWAHAHGLLTGPLPPIEQLQALITTTLTLPSPPQTTSFVEPYRDLVLQLHRDGVAGTAIRERIRERGFTGSVSAMYRFIHRLDPTDPDVTVRVETAPGEEAQVDFGYAGRMLDPHDGRLRKAWAFVMTLSWSRHQYVEFVWDQTVETWLTLHRHAFAYFGGVPKRIKLDNLKAAITKACIDNPQVQQSYRECAEQYGFLIDPCRPRTPEHKGKVESGVKYVKRNFLGGRTPTSSTQANADVLNWCLTTAGQRRHGTTKEQPLRRFSTTERGVLLPLPTSPYDLAIWKVATVQRDCYVVFENAYYSVPFRLVAQLVQIRGGCREVRIYTADWQLVATHQRATAAGERLTHPDHLPPEKLPGLLLGKDACRARAAAIGSATSAVVEDLFADPVVDRLRTVGRILRLEETYGATRLEAACARALTFAEPAHRTIKQILTQGLDHEIAPTPAASPEARTFVRSAVELLGHLFGGATWN